LVEALSVDTGKPLARTALTEEVAKALSIDAERASVLLDALLGAHSVKQRRGASGSDIAVAIVADTALKLSAEECEAGAERLSMLLEIDSLEVLARAVELLVEDGQRFCRARTLSDIRPVFSPDGDPPAVFGAVIRHSLKVRYHVESDTEAFIVTVDDRGLLELRDAIDRAIAKGRSLRRVVEQSGMRLIEVEDSH